MKRGLFFTLEGGDGSGKGTQTKLLFDALQAEGRTVQHLSFPRYGSHSAKTVEMYLRGEFGEANDVAPELASAPFALDRVAAAQGIEEFLSNNPDGILLSDRYTLSNLAHQGTKISDADARKAFYEDSLELEYQDLRIPRPDKTVILLVPSAAAQENVDKKAARSYTSAKRDIHEKDTGHLDKALRDYQELAEYFPDEITAIWAYDLAAGKMRTVGEIHKEIREILDI